MCWGWRNPSPQGKLQYSSERWPHNPMHYGRKFWLIFTREVNGLCCHSGGAHLDALMRTICVCVCAADWWTNIFRMPDWDDWCGTSVWLVLLCGLVWPLQRKNGKITTGGHHVRYSTGSWFSCKCSNIVVYTHPENCMLVIGCPRVVGFVGASFVARAPWHNNVKRQHNSL